MKIQIRTATCEDAKALCEFMEQSFRDTFAEFNTPEDMDAYCRKHFSHAQQRDEIQNPGIITRLMLASANIAGYVQLRPGNAFEHCPLSNPMHLDRIYVAREFLGMGVADSLFLDSMQQAQALNCDGIWLGVWEHNPRAIRFYQKLGFVECGDTRFWLGNDKQRDLLMLKRF
ncbi:GNAT family N-acetyltransferase [Thalassotalea mangrovi]|uniref:GNAT family N-acetyltransferase n=1 Tax=Thalassotalea mangrovi TaxID=2572245 RepID=A0A4U1B1Q9_9GAMM|nr:GNAT family N-acetyltransferase [Thalassotalea mangrovi]TKB43252.1 GNAT family N-acetyltransferase [Thalassotalea mangrovi]